MLKDDARSQGALLKSAEYAQAASTGTSAPVAAKPGGNALPAKLIVSVSKAAADHVAAGKMTFEEFKKTATIDYYTFGTPPKP